jgi:hypothetical protein
MGLRANSGGLGCVRLHTLVEDVLALLKGYPASYPRLGFPDSASHKGCEGRRNLSLSRPNR